MPVITRTRASPSVPAGTERHALGAGGTPARTHVRARGSRARAAHGRVPASRRTVPFVTLALVALLTAGAAVLGVVGGGGSGGTGSGGAPTAAAHRQVPTIVLSADACGPHWRTPTSGQHLLDVKNASRHAIYEVDLVGANQESVFGEIEMLAPGTTVPMDATLSPGRYSFECENYDGASMYSDTESVTGRPVPGAPSYKPVTVDQIEAAIQTYRQSLVPVMDNFETSVDALESAVSSGNLPLARSIWLTADLDWQRMGAVYGAFGKYGTEIDESPLGLPGKAQSPHFTGLLRLEYGLWHGQSAAELTSVAEALATATHGLVAAFPGMLMPDIDLALRTHEILENTLQFQLTGELNEGSGDELALSWADVQGTELSLASLDTLLHTADPRLLARLSTGLTQMADALQAYEEPDGTWMPLSALTTSQREALDGELGGLLQQLDEVPDVLDLPFLPPTADAG